MAVIDTSDVEKALEWLVPPEPASEEEEEEEDEESQEKIDRIEALDDRLSGLFEDDSWVSPGNADKLQGYLSEWIISDAGVAEFKSKVSSGEEDFLGWLEDEVQLWESGEKVAQENPSADPSRPWSAWYKYDTGSQEYYYAEAQHATDWRVWDEWDEEAEAEEAEAWDEEAEAEPPPAYEVHAGTGLELQHSGEYWLYENEWLTDEQLTARVAASRPAAEEEAEAEPPPAYEVHAGTGLELQHSGEYWLYENEWLTDEQLTARVGGSAPAAAEEEEAEAELYEVHPGTGLRLERSGEYWLYENEWLTDEQLTTRVAASGPAAELAAVPQEAASLADAPPEVQQVAADLMQIMSKEVISEGLPQDVMDALGKLSADEIQQVLEQELSLES